MGKIMRGWSVVLAFTAVCAAAVLLFWQHDNHVKAAEVAPYTAHLTRTVNRIQPDGSSANAVSAIVLARDRQGRIYEEFGNGSVLVQDEAKRQTLTWGPHNQMATLGQWPYWPGRKGCWADEHGQNQFSFPTDDDWHKIPASPGEGKLETIASMAVSTDKRVKARVVSENLGQKEINGLAAYGMRWTMTPLESIEPSDIPELTSELWKSKEFDLDLLKVTSGPKYGLDREELSNLQRGDPDPALFEPPKGYKVEAIAYRQVPCGQQ